MFDCVITLPVLIKMKGIWMEITDYGNARAPKIESPWTSVFPAPVLLTQTSWVITYLPSTLTLRMINCHGKCWKMIVLWNAYPGRCALLRKLGGLEVMWFIKLCMFRKPWGPPTMFLWSCNWWESLESGQPRGISRDIEYCIWLID